MDVEVGRDEWEGAGMDGSWKFSRTSSLSETSFRGENAPKNAWRQGSARNRYREHNASPESLTAIDGDELEHSLAGIRGAV